MRPHGDALAWWKHRRAHVIEKYERPDHAALGRRQDSPHVELAETAQARPDRKLDRRGRERAQRLVFNSGAHRKA
jgi:hypothetical protein